MTPKREPLLWQRWEDVDRLLSSALELPRDQRVAFVRSATEDDADLSALVIRLLDRIEQSDQRELFPKPDVVKAAFAEHASSKDEVLETGAIVGRYRILRQVGRGGMATVYEAERADGTYQQRVAIKVLRRGLDTDDLVRRFVTERQILSSLPHPNIARLLDGGATSTGLPFLVMELVLGEPITRWADRQQLDVRSRLRLFQHVAGAVAAAHRRLVVHRDIKPSNVLVDSEGQVKLLDFGIAKLLDHDDVVSRVGTTALTPEYASPEQVNGGIITTGTDVYQLGLLLRELLTGLSPRAGAANTSDPPVRPSRVVDTEVEDLSPPTERARARSTTPDQLRRKLSGELDIIVGKACRTEVEERYSSVDELAADVRRYLDGRPIAAHPESLGYRARKFITRHRWFLPATASVILGIASLLIQDIRVRRERDAADNASKRALATQQFIVDILQSANPITSTSQTARNPDVTLGEVLERGRTRIDRDLVDQPEVRAGVLLAMGQTYTGLGRFAVADTLLREAIRLTSQVEGAESPSLVRATLGLAGNFRSQGRYRESDSLYHAAWRINGAQAVDLRAADMLAEMVLGRRELGDPDSAIGLANQALRIHRHLGDSASPRYFATLGNLALALRGVQKLDSAELVYRLVIRHMEADSNVRRMDIGAQYNNLGVLLRAKGDYSGAVQAYETALAISAEVLGPGHPTSALLRGNLVNSLNLAGRFDDAVARSRDQIVAVEAQWPGGDWRVGSAYAALGRLFLDNGRYGEAVDQFTAAIRSYTASLRAGHVWTLVVRAERGTAQLLAGRAREGQAQLQDALNRLVSLQDSIGPDPRRHLERVASALEREQRVDLAILLRRLVERNPS